MEDFLSFRCRREPAAAVICDPALAPMVYSSLQMARPRKDSVNQMPRRAVLAA